MEIVAFVSGALDQLDFFSSSFFPVLYREAMLLRSLVFPSSPSPSTSAITFIRQLKKGYDHTLFLPCPRLSSGKLRG